jgi:hypothetical protein
MLFLDIRIGLKDKSDEISITVDNDKKSKN